MTKHEYLKSALTHFRCERAQGIKFNRNSAAIRMIDEQIANVESDLREEEFSAPLCLGCSLSPVKVEGEICKACELDHKVEFEDKKRRRA